MTEIVLPHNNWQPRNYQMQAWEYLEQGGRHLEIVAHRRWGKDELALHNAAIKMIERPATYWHMLPLKEQVRKAIWESVNPHTGKRRIDEAFPDELFKKRESDMLIKCRYNDSTWQALGSDNFQSFIGSPPAGITYSEWALSNPSARGYLRPIIAENKGWQIFIGTPRGKNHAFRTFEAAKKTKGALAIFSSVTQTQVLSSAELELEKMEYVSTYGEQMGLNLFGQEWFCLFDVPVIGAVWGAETEKVEQEGRITTVKHQAGFKVFTAWDIGRSDATAIWFFQIIKNEIHVIDYLSESFRDPDYFASQMLGKQTHINIDRGEIIVEYGASIPEAKHRQAYDYGTLWLPHDAKAKTFSAKGKSTEELFAKVFGWSLIRIVPRLSIYDGIQAARKTFARCYFDEQRTQAGFDMLKMYRYEWDEKNKMFKTNPLHDVASNTADAFRYLSIAWSEKQIKAVEKPRFELDQSITELIERNRRKRLLEE